MDEKQKSIICSAMAKVLVIVYIIIFIVGISKFIISRSIMSCIFELIFIAAVPVLVFLFSRMTGKVTFPDSIAGLEVRPEGTRKAFRGRIRAYIHDSLLYSVFAAIFIAISDVWQAYRERALADSGFSEWMTEIASLLLQFLIFFIVFFALNYCIYEYKANKFREQNKRKKQRARKYEKMMEESAADEEE